MRHSKRASPAFTLIELLVVIAIIAILFIVVILTLNPAELFKQARDSNRVSDLSTLGNALSLSSLGTANTTYLSIPDPFATSTAGDQCQALGMPSSSSTYHCAGSQYYRKIDGTGWIPVNLKNISSGAPIGSLAADPVNQSSSGLYYTYTTDGGTLYELTAQMESQKYQSVEQTDGGKYADLYEKGTSLTLAARDFASTSSPGSNPFGFDLRNTTSYVTDPAGNVPIACNGSNGPQYPTSTTANGVSVTYGFMNNYQASCRDRSTTVDPRLAGLVNTYVGDGNLPSYAIFEFDIPAGTYDVNLAAGDESYSGQDSLNFYDGATSTLLWGFNDVAYSAGSEIDANGNVYTDANWPSQNTSHRTTLTSGKLLIQMGDPASSTANYGSIQYIHFTPR